VASRQVYPELQRVQHAPFGLKVEAGVFVVQHAAASLHPLRAAGHYEAVVASAVVVL
jgi:hypothetical protein